MKRVIIGGAVGIAALGLIVAGGAFWFFQPLTNSSQAVTIEIPRGSSEVKVGEILTQAGVIRHPMSLRLATKLQGISGQIQAGVYQVDPSLSVFAVARSLTKNTTDLRVTLPEGLRAEEVVTELSQALNIDGAETNEICLAEEGFLFPDTYSFIAGTTLPEACQRLQSQFEQVWKRLTTAVPAPVNWTKEELVILASLVQREAKDPQDMQRVAGVLFNRLQLGMPLQIDATLQYAKGYDETNKTWWPTPLAADKAIDSRYNTYKYPGLPAGPISNPGEHALQAVLQPIISDHLYYISTLDGSEMYFAETYPEHQANVERYLR